MKIKNICIQPFEIKVSILLRFCLVFSISSTILSQFIDKHTHFLWQQKCQMTQLTFGRCECLWRVEMNLLFDCSNENVELWSDGFSLIIWNRDSVAGYFAIYMAVYPKIFNRIQTRK